MWSRFFHLRISLFESKQVMFLLGLHSSCLMEREIANEDKSETTQMMK